MNSARSIASVVGSAAATPPVAALRVCSSPRRVASAAIASCLVANPICWISFGSLRVAPSVNWYRHTTRPESYLYLETGITTSVTVASVLAEKSRRAGTDPHVFSHCSKAYRVTIHFRPRRTAGMMPCSSIA